MNRVICVGIFALAMIGLATAQLAFAPDWKSFDEERKPKEGFDYAHGLINVYELFKVRVEIAGMKASDVYFQNHLGKNRLGEGKNPLRFLNRAQLQAE